MWCWQTAPPAKAEALAAELGCRTGTNEDAAGCDLVFLGVKPQMMAGMLAPLQAVFAARAAKGERFVLCTMAAGLTMAQIRQMAGGDYPVVRVNPNIPSAVGEGMVPYCTLGITGAEEADFRRVMAGAGRLDPLDENLIDASSCVSGCGPAWACQFIEALADGGVACGLPRAKAQQYAAQMVLGTARMLLENDGHPRRFEGRRLQPRRHHHPGGARAGGARLPRRGHGRRHRRLRKDLQAAGGLSRCALSSRSAHRPSPTPPGG